MTYHVEEQKCREWGWTRRGSSGPPDTRSNIFYPHGANLWFHSRSPLHGHLGVLLRSVCSPAATLNVLLLLNLVASGGLT